MICQKCHTEVDDDLIFCTNCGERLIHSQGETQTVLINNPVPTQSTVNSPSPKQSSNLKWVALIVALMAIPASIFGVYLLMKQNRTQISQNTNKPNTPTVTPTRKANANQNLNANLPNINANRSNANVNANTNSANQKDKNEIMNERIEIAPKTHYAVPFEVETDTAVIVGKVKILQGEKFDGYVYSQEMYDNHFPNTTYKVFSFEGEKNTDVNQTLVESDYVLIFVNKSEKPLVIQGNFSLK